MTATITVTAAPAAPAAAAAVRPAQPVIPVGAPNTGVGPGPSRAAETAAAAVAAQPAARSVAPVSAAPVAAAPQLPSTGSGGLLDHSPETGVPFLVWLLVVLSGVTILGGITLRARHLSRIRR